ncbi:bax inhibitor 1-like [Gigantopelta aegis]|uniref:bax inhibitor 1-like n=1 Tax=Gigantopelta aegis TaxID=1735272 RepID=UPI001B88950F|nr:bax inhibitor 1-like [Gigantopelta aegis]
MSSRSNNDLFPPSLFKFDHLSGPVKQHLKNVYSTLSIGMLTACVGAYVHLFTGIMQAGLLTALGSVGLMMWLMFTKHSKETQLKRLAIFSGFTFLSGLSLGPLLDMAIQIEPSIIPSALMGTSVIFISFSLASIYSSNDRTFLYMGGVLLSALSWMVLLTFANIFFGSQMIYDITLYGGLILFCAFILFDTQLIIEKRLHGDDDYIWHSVDLFLDFIQVFRRLVIILSNKESKKNKKN